MILEHLKLNLLVIFFSCSLSFFLLQAVAINTDFSICQFNFFAASTLHNSLPQCKCNDMLHFYTARSLPVWNPKSD